MKPKIRIALCAIAKNESLYIREWVEYYRNIVGVDKIFIYDNNRLRDNSLSEALEKQIRSGFVSVIDYRGREISRTTDQNGDTLQGIAYKECYEENSQYYDWMAFFDIDEFLDVEHRTLRNVLASPEFEDTDVIHFQWKMYGDNGHIRYRNESVLSRFKNENNASYSTYTKAIVKTGLTGITFGAHGPLGSDIKHRLSNGKSMFNTYQTDMYKDLDMYLMHFFTKSTEEFFKRKYNKTSAVTGKSSPRNYNAEYLTGDDKDAWGYFKINKKTDEKIAFIKEFIKDADTPKIIVSLTSYKKRLKFVPTVIRSILNQYLKPYKIILTLYKDDIEYIPDELNWYIKHGDVDLKVVDDDLGPHKKYYYVMQEYRDNPIVTIDDDIMYTPDMLENLWETHMMYPDAIVARRVHYITLKDNKVMPYNTWRNQYTVLWTPNYNLFATTGAGTLFPENILNIGPEHLNDIKNCLYADDIYIKWLSNKNNVNVVWAKNNTPMSWVIKDDILKDDALYIDNVINGRNDEYMKKFDLLHPEMSGYEEPVRKIEPVLPAVAAPIKSPEKVLQSKKITQPAKKIAPNNFGPILRRRH